MLIWHAKATTVFGLISYAMQYMSFLGLTGNMLLLRVVMTGSIVLLKLPIGYELSSLC